MNPVLRSIPRWRPPIWLYAVVATALLVGVVAFPSALINALITIVQLAILAVAFVVAFRVGRWLLNRGNTDAHTPGHIRATQYTAATSETQDTKVLDLTMQSPTQSTIDPDPTRVMPTNQGATRRIDW